MTYVNITAAKTKFLVLLIIALNALSVGAYAQSYVVDSVGELYTHEQPIVEYGGVNYYYCAGYPFNWTSNLVLVSEVFIFDGNFNAGEIGNPPNCATDIQGYISASGDAVGVAVIEVNTGSGAYQTGTYFSAANTGTANVAAVGNEVLLNFTNTPGSVDPPDPNPSDIPQHTFYVNPLDMAPTQIVIDGGSFGDYVYCGEEGGSHLFVGGDAPFDQCEVTGWLPRLLISGSEFSTGEESVIGNLRFENEAGEPDSAAITVLVPPELYGTGLEGGEDPPPTCEDSDVAFAWGLCPVTRFVLNTLDNAVQGGIVQTVLNFDALDSGSPQRAGLQNVWDGFRTIANVGFALAFFIMVYSAASGGLMSAYDVKKLLPRVVLGALLVQLSFFIATQLVVVFNALGNSITRLMLAPIGVTDADSAVDALFQPGEGSVDYSTMEAVLQGVASAIIIILVIIGGLMAIFGILIMVVVFVIRNMALIVMTVIAPIAFVSWILPNTESLFKKWWQFYIQLLALFPIAMGFLASGKLISYIWVQGNPNSWTNHWLGMIALFAPYLLAPRLFSFAGSAIGGLVGGVENARKGLKERAGKARQTSFGKRAESSIRSGAATRINQRWGVGQKGENSLIGRAVRTGTVQRATARAQQTQRNIKGEDTKAARINVDANRIGAQKGFTGFVRDDAGQVVTGAGGQPVELPSKLTGDDAEIEYLTQVLESEVATGEEKASAVDALLNVHTSDGRAIQAVNSFMVGTDGQGGLQNSSDPDEGDLYNRILEQNGGELSSIPHLAYPNAASSISQMDARQFHGMAAGSVAAFMKDPGASDAMIERTIQAVNASGESPDAPRAAGRQERHSTEAQFVRDANVAIMYTNANAAQRARLDAQFDIERLPKYEESGEVMRDANNEIVWDTDDRNQPIYRVAGKKRVGAYTDAIENGEIPSPTTRVNPDE